MPCTSLITYTLNNGEQLIREIKAASPAESFELICTEGVRIESQNRAFALKVRTIEIKLERDE